MTKEPKTFKAWYPSDWLIYGGGFMFSLLAGSVACMALLRQGESTAKAVCANLLWVTWGAICIVRYVQKRRWVEEIKWITYQGVSVKPGDSAYMAEQELIEEAVQSTIDYWSGEYPHHADDIEDAFNGLLLVVAPGPVSDKRHGVLDKKGLTANGTVAVNGSLPLQEFIATVSHEFGHVALLAAGVAYDNAIQHDIMSSHGWKFA